MLNKFFGQKLPVNQDKIKELLTRGVERIYPDSDFLLTVLNSGKKLTIFTGIDPTGPTLHLGHAITLMKLKQFQDLGHQVILLIGDFTAQIGDPTDKMAARIPLTHQQVLKNAKLYKKQASHILNFSGNNSAKIKYNSAWLEKLSFAGMQKLNSLMTVEQLLKRDMFEKRQLAGKPIYLHEFLYPVLQGYDSVAMDVDGEIGGNDQTFNMLAGRDLMKKIKNKEKFVISLRLLEDASGKKMGKTEGNMVALNESAEQMFGKIMSWADGLIIPGFELCTQLPSNKIVEMKKTLESGVNPKQFKLELAKTIVSIYHGQAKAVLAEKNFEATFSAGQIPDDLPLTKVMKGALLVDIAIQEKIVSSRSEWHRLVSDGAIYDLEKKQKIFEPTFRINQSSVFKIGKKRFLKISIPLV